ncbi:hypothetical protein E2C01_039364 [Portunus trituberculatus]|uniref:Uncharacterized protein n=1 Tax=Portunus trituberculatus TaxID=210409 RepID=A0A5B7FL61_PORTR|nr:hypothetical protein [Portunus trituberculatus]
MLPYAWGHAARLVLRPVAQAPRGGDREGQQEAEFPATPGVRPPLACTKASLMNTNITGKYQTKITLSSAPGGAERCLRELLAPPRCCPLVLSGVGRSCVS